MPSPFPGMDPYLEHPARWPGVHLGLIATLRVMLNSLLPGRYVADAGERLYVVQPERSIYPDLFISERPSSPSRGGSGTAVAAPTDEPWIIIADPEEHREPFVVITLSDDPSRVVAAIELLSPANKAGGHPGHDLYRRKQRELLDSPVHLLELDLLRLGEHTVAAPYPELVRRGRWDYLVSLHRGGAGNRYEVWPVLLTEPLPRIRIPLLEGEPDLSLDLQAVFHRFYDENAYGRRLDYSRDPVPPLDQGRQAWAKALLGAPEQR